MLRNKFADTCAECGTKVAADEGYLDKTEKGWDVYCESHKRAVNTLRVKPNWSGRGKHGSTMGLNVRDTWVHVFEGNESRYEAWTEGKSSEQPLTDLQISDFMKDEFPSAGDTAYTTGRIRMYRSTYNVGSHSFKALGTPERVSREFTSEGKPVEKGSRGVSARVTEDRIAEIVKKLLADRPMLKLTIGRKIKKIDTAGKHKALTAVLECVAAGLPILLVGPTGSGKTYLSKQIAEALGTDFTFNSMSEGISESTLLGRTLPNGDGVWEYVPSPFVSTYTNGGVHLLDEIDASDPNLLVQVNAAIANKMLSLPFADVKPIPQHKDTTIVCAANTWGTGADREYVGRNQLDAATLNRFSMSTIEVGYDPDLEHTIAHAILDDGAKADRLLKWAHGVRKAIADNRLRRVMSTRDIENAAKLMTAGKSLEAVKERFFTPWTVEEAMKVNYTKKVS